MSAQLGRSSRVSADVRDWWISVVVCATVHAAPRAPAVSREIYFPVTEDGGEDDAHVRVVLPIAEREKAIAADVVAYDAGRVAPIWLRWRSDWPGSYAASVRARPNTGGEYGLAVVIPHDPAIRTVRIGKRDAAAIDGLTAKDLARVDLVRTFGLDLDGDGRADIAFAKVCGWEHPDGMCEGHYELVVKRNGEEWRPTRTCHPDTIPDEPCWTW